MYSKIKKLIEDSHTILIFSHIFPDGDAFGSQVGLKEALKSTYPNKNVFILGSGIKEFSHILGETDEVEDECFNDALAILLDTNDIERFEDPRCKLVKHKILIDHHLKQNRSIECDVAIQDERASSTCELVLDLCRKLKLQINERAANAIFLGYLTDTGRFQYVNDFKKVFKDVAFLVDVGAEPAKLFKVLNVVREKDLLIRSIVFSKLKRYKQGLLVSYLRYKDIKKTGLSSTQIANYVNLLANIEHYPIWVIACEDEEGNVKFEFRSNEFVIQPIAAKYGGGGHAFACGLTLKNCTNQLFKAVIADLLELLEDK